jgi:hypothetical protein
MSTINYDYNPQQGLTEEDIRRIAREENTRGKRETLFNPVTGNFHDVTRGLLPTPNPNNIYQNYSVDNDVFRDIWRTAPVIMNAYQAKEGAKRLAAGQLNDDSARYAPFSQEYEDTALRFNELKEKVRRGEIGSREAAGIIRNSDYQAIAEPLSTNEIIDLTLVEYVLEGAVTNKTSDVLKVVMPGTATAGKPWSKGMRESDTPDPWNPTISTGPEVSLQKMATRYEISTWFDLTARRFNVEQMTKQQIDADAPRIYDEEIRALLLTFTNVAAGTEWDVMTTAPRSDVDPKVKIEEVLKTISDNAGRADTAVMHPGGFNAMIDNSFMLPAGLVNQNQTNAVATADQFGAVRRHEKLPDLTIYTSRNAPIGSMYIYDKDTAILFKGPARVGNYEDILGTHRGTLYERWYGTAVLQAGWGREITGIQS